MMVMMEDSGIDSGDKINSICFESSVETKDNIFIESDNSSNDNVEVVFRNPCIDRFNSKIRSLETGNENGGDDNVDDNFGIYSPLDTEDAAIGSTSNANARFSATKDDASNESYTKVSQTNSCKVLQRKLELKVERAKRNYSQLHEEKDTKTKSSGNLIPITRLQIPGCADNVPLVEYNSDNSDDDVISFFPTKQKNKKQDLSDTFSIQEMTIESDTDDSESQYLELLPPTRSERAFEKLLICVCCENERQKCVIL